MLAEAETRPPAKPFLFIIGPFAPPIHGMAATTQGVTSYAARHFRMHVANVAFGLRGGWRGHLVKAFRFLRALVQLPAKAFRYRSPALYMASDGAFGINYNIIVAIVARLFGYRIFVHHHSYAYINRYSHLMATLGRAMGSNGTHIVLCAAMASGLRERYPHLQRAPMLELYSAAFVELPVVEERVRKPVLQMGFLSNLIIEKGLDTSIDLLRAARASNLAVRLIVAGKSYDERASRMMASALAEFGDAIEYRGPLSEEQKDQFYRDIDIFVFPTRYKNEAQPRAINEALCFGIPVLTIARSCIPSDMGEGCGLCVNKDADFVQIALPQLREWCENPASLECSSRQALNRAAVLYKLGQDELQMIAQAFGAHGKSPDMAS